MPEFDELIAARKACRICVERSPGEDPELRRIRVRSRGGQSLGAVARPPAARSCSPSARISATSAISSAAAGATSRTTRPTTICCRLLDRRPASTVTSTRRSATANAPVFSDELHPVPQRRDDERAPILAELGRMPVLGQHLTPAPCAILRPPDRRRYGKLRMARHSPRLRFAAWRADRRFRTRPAPIGLLADEYPGICRRPLLGHSGVINRTVAAAARRIGGGSARPFPFALPPVRRYARLSDFAEDRLNAHELYGQRHDDPPDRRAGGGVHTDPGAPAEP